MSELSKNVRTSPFRSPNWRSERAKDIASRGKHSRCSKRDDKFIKEYRAFLVKYNRGGGENKLDNLFSSNPGLYYAHAIYLSHQSDEKLPLLVEARILSGQANEQIALMISTIPEAIEYYEKLFFSVRDRRESVDWVMSQIIIPSMAGVPESFSGDPYNYSEYSNYYYSSTLKYFAYFGGPVVCDLMIYGTYAGGQPKSADDVEDYIESQFMLKIGRSGMIAAHEHTSGEHRVSDVFKTYSTIMAMRSQDKGSSTGEDSFEDNVMACLFSAEFNVGEYSGGDFRDEVGMGPIELRHGEVATPGSGVSSGLGNYDEYEKIPHIASGSNASQGSQGSQGSQES